VVGERGVAMLSHKKVKRRVKKGERVRRVRVRKKRLEKVEVEGRREEEVRKTLKRR
jgi:hypothetical protein